jgi:hypothetical protein
VTASGISIIFPPILSSLINYIPLVFRFMLTESRQHV